MFECAWYDDTIQTQKHTDNPYFASMIHNFWLSWFAFGGPLTFQLISMSPRLNLHVMESIQREMIFEKQLHNIQGG